MIKLELTEQDMYLIAQALKQMPYYAVAELIEKISAQAKPVDKKA